MNVLGIDNHRDKKQKKYDIVVEDRPATSSETCSPRSSRSPRLHHQTSQVHEAVETIATSWVSRTFMSGCAILLPVFLTLAVTSWLVEAVDAVFSPVYTKIFHVQIFGLGFLTAVALIFVAGILARSWIGSVFISLSELIFDRLPFVTQIYSAAKQIGQAIDPSNEKAAFKECVLIKHPRHGEFALAFVTGECYLQEELGSRSLVIVYVPTNHIYVGDIFMLGPEDIIHTSLTVGEGLEVAVSMGMAMPKSLKSLPKEKKRFHL